MKVNEFFHSIQGESSWAGLPCVFVRLTGCNLRCSYCDTRYAYEEGVELEIADILEQVAGYGCSLVEITGGEPLLQEDTPLLIRALLDKGFQVLLETNGSLDIGAVDGRCHRIMDVKLPQSGAAAQNRLENLPLLKKGDELKFVIGGREDYDYAGRIMKLIPLDIRGEIVINFSPLFGTIEPRLLAAWILADRLPVRLHLQLHKLIWPPEIRGV